jgi:hypothetical protein
MIKIPVERFRRRDRAEEPNQHKRTHNGTGGQRGELGGGGRKQQRGTHVLYFKKEEIPGREGGRNDDEMKEAKPTPHQGFNYIACITRSTSHPAIT